MLYRWRMLYTFVFYFSFRVHFSKRSHEEGECKGEEEMTIVGECNRFLDFSKHTSFSANNESFFFPPFGRRSESGSIKEQYGYKAIALILGSLPSALAFYCFYTTSVEEKRLTLLSHLARIFLALACRTPISGGGRGEGEERGGKK